jgi:DNA-binding NtrC family response regulator
MKNNLWTCWPSAWKPGGYAVATANSGDQALALLRAQEMDVVILDVLMPGKSGPDTFSPGAGKSSSPRCQAPKKSLL